MRRRRRRRRRRERKSKPLSIKVNNSRVGVTLDVNMPDESLTTVASS